MKKQIITLAIAGALCLGALTACGGTSTDTNSNANNANTTNTTATTTNTNANANANANANTTTTNTNTSSSSIAAIEDQLKANLSTCYMGVGGDYQTGQAVEDFDTSYYMGFSTDATWGIVVAVSEEPADNGKYPYISFVGNVTANGDNSYTIADETSGLALTFTATDNGDGTWILDLGSELGKAQVAACDSSSLVTALELIDELGEPMA